MSSTSQPGASLLGVAGTWYSNLPLCTKSTFSLITGVFIVQLITGWYGNLVVALSLAPDAVLYHFQLYRIFTAVLIHGGLLHVTFNMLAFVPMSASLERTVGTLQLLHFLLISCFLEGCLYVALSVLLATSGLIPGAMMHGAMGFSGVIFGLVVWDSALSTAPYCSIFGLFQVPKAWYPWVLLLFCQLLLPEASFVGHLAGLLVGQLWVGGYLRPLALSRSATLWLEQSSVCARCIRLSSFILMPSSLPYTTYDSARGSPGLGGGASGSQGSSSSGGGGARFGGLGRNLMTLGKLLRSGGGVAGGGADGRDGEGSGEGGDVEAGGVSTNGSQGRGAFAGTGRVLGGGTGSVGGAAAAQAPSVAAALAAEARMGGSSGVAGGSSSGNGGGGAAVASGGSKTNAARDKVSKA